MPGPEARQTPCYGCHMMRRGLMCIGCA